MCSRVLLVPSAATGTLVRWFRCRQLDDRPQVLPYACLPASQLTSSLPVARFHLLSIAAERLSSAHGPPVFLSGALVCRRIRVRFRFLSCPGRSQHLCQQTDR
eukprot:GHVU01047666.1.p1 GENE.GHVU01047666.1~~GHVU01047666.1.p1  ORF type:complete len:103 (-),score=2.05 GHVU01047666.1:195-503(-)